MRLDLHEIGVCAFHEVFKSGITSGFYCMGICIAGVGSRFWVRVRVWVWAWETALHLLVFEFWDALLLCIQADNDRYKNIPGICYRTLRLC